ncbi:molybdopterin-dependent oxidoreductase [Sorangium sp. So ce429]
MAQPEIKQTFCRICEALCGLEATVEGDTLVSLRPDREHPLSKGFACVKGVQYAGIHEDPDRLNHPMKRTPSGFQRISWETALSEIGERLREQLRRHGPRSMGMYLGNPTFFNYKALLFAQDFMRAVGSPNLFASHSIDCNNKLKVAELMYGLAMAHPVPDLVHTRFFLCLGSNPTVSQMSFVHAPNALGQLKDIVKRGGRVILVDPRRTETADQVGEHLFIRPGTDAYLLLAMGQVLFAEGRCDVERLKAIGNGAEELRAAVRAWTPERVEPITGIPAGEIRALARDYAEANGAAIHISTGVNMGPFGSIAYWMAQALNLASGNVDRRGGLLMPKGPFDLLSLGSRSGFGKSRARTRVGGHEAVYDALPSGALAEEITQPGEDRLRSLIVCAGNPAHSIPGGRLREALKQLDTLVCIDIYRNATAEHAHYLLPATDMLERSDIPLGMILSQVTPYAQFSERVVAPKHERREEWEIFSELLLACGIRPKQGNLCSALPQVNRFLKYLPGKLRVEPDHLLELALRVLGDVSLSRLRAQPRGAFLPPTQPGSFLGKRVFTPDGRVDLAPRALVQDLTRLAREEARFQRHAAQGDSGPRDVLELFLVGRRERRSHNSWMLNNSRLRQPPTNVCLLSPEDAAQAGIRDRDLVAIRSEGREIVLPVELSDAVGRGVIVVPHGWGHAQSGMSVASHLGGANVNEVIPGGTANLEPVSGQAIMTGHVVQVRRAPTATAPANDSGSRGPPGALPGAGPSPRVNQSAPVEPEGHPR